MDFDVGDLISIPTITAGDVQVALEGVTGVGIIAIFAYAMWDGEAPDAVKVPASDVKSKTTAAATTTAEDLAPYVTTQWAEVLRTEAYNSDEAYALDNFLQTYLLSFFPTVTTHGPMPTLPKPTTKTAETITISTPAGSSCAKTTTTELCTVPREPCATSVGVLVQCLAWCV